MDLFSHYPSSGLSLFISFPMNDRNKSLIGTLLWISLHQVPFLPIPTQSYQGPHRRDPGARRANKAAQRIPLILLLSRSRLALGHSLD